ncbi:HD domain-containing protein [Hydrogenophaga sp. NFH-34]|uniref:HD domain-containing protein n=1 Tax=Hydrogenophaga sp. NFH-34 TaxID=2744446 RepID=UPI001F2BCCBF|nr:HD domain-containing protein [Hydrogenophaga sp. NFH-34]
MQQSLAFDAMTFALQAHAGQKRKYTGDPYFTHLAEVAGTVSAVAAEWISEVSVGGMLATAYLHDTREDCGISEAEIESRFGVEVAHGVTLLSDLGEGNRATRKALARARLAAAPGWVQTIKCADLISNTSSIALHDPKFARVYVPERQDLLYVLGRADRRLHALALKQIQEINLSRLV